jgi:hypothetical protein
VLRTELLLAADPFELTECNADQAALPGQVDTGAFTNEAISSGESGEEEGGEEQLAAARLRMSSALASAFELFTPQRPSADEGGELFLSRTARRSGNRSIHNLTFAGSSYDVGLDSSDFDGVDMLEAARGRMAQALTSAFATLGSASADKDRHSESGGWLTRNLTWTPQPTIEPGVETSFV